MRARVARGRIIAATIAVVGAAAGVAYAAAPDSTGRASSELAGITRPHEVIGKQEYNAGRRKRGVAKCRPGETAISGGYILAGAFQAEGSPAPGSLPVVTESTPSFSSIAASGPPDVWTIVAIAPRSFRGPWGLTPKAICVRGR